MQANEQTGTGGFFARASRTLGIETADRPSGGRTCLLFAFLIPFALMTLLYAGDYVFPFGGNSVLVLDLNGQYIGFFEALRAAVWGDGSLLYSFARSLGGEMMGIYAYYLASPLSYLVALFPRENITEALLFIFLLKTGLSGLTFSLWLRARRIGGGIANVMFSVLYALSSYAVVFQHNTMWMDGVYLFPLVILGVEEAVRRRRFSLYIPALALTLISNFYIGFMTCVFVVLYFFYFLYAHMDGEICNPDGEEKHYPRALLRMVVYSLIAVGIAAFILLAAAYALSMGKNEFTMPSFVPRLQFDPLRFFVKLLPATYDTVQPEGLPFVYCGVLTLLLLPLYFGNRRFARSERIASGVFLVVMYLSMSVSSLDMLWHGGQAPNWLNARYAFMLCFFLLTLAARAYAQSDGVSCRCILFSGAGVAVLTAVTACLNDENFRGATVALAFVCLAVSLLLLIGRARLARAARPALSLCLLLAVCAEVYLNGGACLAGLHADVGATSRAYYYNYRETTGALLTEIREADRGFYRMETTNHRTINDVMEIGYRGVTNSTSTLNAKTLLFLQRIGLLAVSHWSQYEGATMASDSLLGIRYIVTNRAPYEEYLLYKRGRTISAYENPYALPIAFAAAEGIRAYDPAAVLAAPAQLNGIISAMAGAEYAMYLPLDFTSDSEGLTMIVDGNQTYLFSDYYAEHQTEIENGTLDTKGMGAPTARLTFRVTVPQDGNLFFCIPSDQPSKMAFELDGTYFDDLYGEDDNIFLKNLGARTAGEEVTVTLFMQETLSFCYRNDTPFFFVENTEAVAEAMTSLGTYGIALSDFTEDSFTGRITTTAERPVVQTTIPYDAGWRVTVDGRPVSTYATCDALLAFDAAPGEHEVHMVYFPSVYTVGLVISAVSAVLFVLLLLLSFLWRRGKITPRGGAARAMALFLQPAPRVPGEDAYEPTEPEEPAPTEGPALPENGTETGDMDVPQDGDGGGDL